jgi:rod shape-determining protein MreC
MLRDISTRKGRYEREPAAGGRRALVVLGVLLVLSAAIGWWHARALARGRASPISEGAALVMGPLQRACAWAVRGVEGTSTAMRRSRREAAENQRLRLRMRALQESNRELASLAEENQRLRRLLALRGRLSWRTIAAGVVGRDPGVWNSALVIDRGRADGIRPRQVVLGVDGLVGQVVSVSQHSARVLLITDSASGVGALAARSGATGVAKGTGDSCEVRYLALDTAVKPGDSVITSGLGGIFPRGLPLGTISRVERDPSTATSHAALQPAQEMSAVREVLVIAVPASEPSLSQTRR